ncbi:MAG: hypothetical protein KIS85_06315 [Anaerolineales bacterium]|nr:hypothetical protein [Anaerolineales bacterium]
MPEEPDAPAYESPEIEDGYCTLAEYKAYRNIPEAVIKDDAVLAALIERASRYIDRQTGQRFVAATAMRQYEPPASSELELEAALQTLSGLVNADGTTIALGDVRLLPLNGEYKTRIRLTADAPGWGGGDGLVEVTGSWGRFAEPPEDIRLACMEIVRAAEARRTGQGSEAVARVTAAGVVITPQDTPKQAMAIIKMYRRLT